MKQINKILLEYSKLPEYSGLGIPAVNSVSLFGDYPINIAATRGILNEVLLLLSEGVDINEKGEHGYTPLHNAVEQGHLDVVKVLVESGADSSIKNNDGCTPLKLAALLKEEKIQQLLVENQCER